MLMLIILNTSLITTTTITAFKCFETIDCKTGKGIWTEKSNPQNPDSKPLLLDFGVTVSSPLTSPLPRSGLTELWMGVD